MSVDLYLKARADMGDKLAAFMLTHGKHFTADADTFKGRRGKQGMCYMNATRIAWHADNIGKLFYVEGIVCVHGISIEHAWVTDLQGKIFDPTFRVKPQKFKGRMPRNDPNRIDGYFGVVFGHKYLTKATLDSGYYGLLGWRNTSIKDLVEGNITDFGP